jgi:hypothetical protein
MKREDVDSDFVAIYPLTRAEIRNLPLAEAEQELLAAILAEPEEPTGRRGEHSGWRPFRRPRSLPRYGAGMAIAIAAAIALLVVFGTGGGGSPSPAFATGLVRVAKASPLVLLDAPGWRVEDIAGVTDRKGEMRFSYGRAASTDPRHRAELRWHAGRVTSRMLSRLVGPTREIATPVLDTQVLALHSSGGPKHRQIAAIWQDAGKVMVFRSTVPDLKAFEKRLGALHRVGATAWLSSLPRKLTRDGGALRPWARLPAR